MKNLNQLVYRGSPLHAVSVHTDSQNAFFWTNTFILTKSQKLMFSYQKNLVFCNFFKVQSILTIHISGFRKINHFHLNLKCLAVLPSSDRLLLIRFQFARISFHAVFISPINPREAGIPYNGLSIVGIA